MHACIYVYIHTYICIYIYLYIYNWASPSLGIVPLLVETDHPFYFRLQVISWRRVLRARVGSRPSPCVSSPCECTCRVFVAHAPV